MGNKASKTETKNDIGDDEDIDLDAQDAANKPSYYTMMKQAYQSLVNAIIRPPRSDYETSQLGPSTFDYCGKTFKRTDFELTNPRNLKFVCSMWEPIPADRPNKVLPCVIYMHGNSSSRLEALSSLSLVLSLGATLLCLDFCGSGKSEGEYVTLGYFEKDDLDVVIQHLRDAGTTSTIALWGRSMGAATALLHGERDPSIAGMVLDSAFADLVMLSEELVDKGREKGLFAPGMLVKIALRFVRSSVLKQAGFDIRLLSPIEHADKCFIPAMFIAAEGDAFVGKQHSEKIFAKYGGDKNIVLVEGDHNSARPLFLYDSVSIFLVNTLQIPDEWILPEGQNYIRKYPWTYRSRQGARQGGRLSENFSLQMALQYDVQSPRSDDEYMSEEERQQLNDLLALSLLESQQGALMPDNIEIAPNMETDAEMQVEVQSALFNMLSGGTAGKGSNRTGKPNTPIYCDTDLYQTKTAPTGTVVKDGDVSHDKVPVVVSIESHKKHAAKGRYQLAFSADEAEDDSDTSLPPSNRHPSGVSSTSSTPNVSTMHFFGEDGSNSPQPGVHPKALANKSFGRDSSFNKIFGSNHSMNSDTSNNSSMNVFLESDMSAKEKQVVIKNTLLNSSSNTITIGTSTNANGDDDDNETFEVNKSNTLTDFDLNDEIEFDMDSIKFHSRSKSIRFEASDIPVADITAEDEFGFDAYTSPNAKSSPTKTDK